MNLLTVNIETNRLSLTPISYNYMDEVNNLLVLKKTKTTVKNLMKK